MILYNNEIIQEHTYQFYMAAEKCIMYTVLHVEGFCLDSVGLLYDY